MRSLATQLGVAKNTANRAIGTLLRAGVVEAVQNRGSDGQFRPGAYRLHLDGITATPPLKRTRQRTTARTTADPAQLSLLPQV